MGIWSVYINSFLSINGGTDSFHRDATQILQPFPLALPNPPTPPEPGDNYPSVPKCQLLNFYLEMILAGKFQPIGDTADAQ